MFFGGVECVDLSQPTSTSSLASTPTRRRAEPPLTAAWSRRDTTDERGDGDERPSNCDCGGWNTDADLPCWPCYRDGFNTPVSADK